MTATSPRDSDSPCIVSRCAAQDEIRTHPVTAVTPVTALDATAAFSAMAASNASSPSATEAGQSAPSQRLAYTGGPSPPGGVAAYDARCEVIRYMETTPLDSGSSSGTPPPGTNALPPGVGETFDSPPPTPQSPSYSPVPTPEPSPEPEDQAPSQAENEGTASQSPAQLEVANEGATSQSPAQLGVDNEVDNEVDNQERRAIRLALRAEEHLQELFPGTMPTIDAILQWTEWFFLGDYAYKEVDEHALNRIIDHFVQLAHDAMASPAGPSTVQPDL